MSLKCGRPLGDPTNDPCKTCGKVAEYSVNATVCCQSCCLEMIRDLRPQKMAWTVRKMSFAEIERKMVGYHVARQKTHPEEYTIDEA